MALLHLSAMETVSVGGMSALRDQGRSETGGGLMDLRQRVWQWQDRRRCVGCHKDLEARQFVPNDHCGSPTVYHDLCQTCQPAWADRAASELAMYLETSGVGEANAELESSDGQLLSERTTIAGQSRAHPLRDRAA